MQLIQSFCIYVGHSHLSLFLSFRARAWIYKERTNKHSIIFHFLRIQMENISKLLRDIRQVEQAHNQLVDEYFQISNFFFFLVLLHS